ncbi:hypothetical protein CTAM01_06924 [Colletotrichum tamarilloi]|uniref:Uncharacterized protein n=1 Tax=Colletotrichum tamarilloi TaxID=1209934 RepID=A0ABQ9RAJ8_9PEZI|nr:uncharacterized protein CTAM01_06924 [Colletotrichum tamarilloi]KAK1499730.1 hypothetical protein CTAM01_06924 [Colletotrichum tamarilloi]
MKRSGGGGGGGGNTASCRKRIMYFSVVVNDFLFSFTKHRDSRHQNMRTEYHAA